MRQYFNFGKCFYWALGICAAIIPFPGNSLSSISIIVLSLFWILYKPFKEKWNLLIQNKLLILIFSIPFLLMLLGMIYTDNPEEGLKKIQLTLPFLIFPLILFSTKLEKRTDKFVLSCFVVGTFTASLIGILKAFYYKMNGLGDYLFNEKFSELLDKHTTYFSLFVVISMLFILYEAINKRIKWFFALALFSYFLIVLYVVSTRISIIALCMGILILVLSEIKSSHLKWMVLAVPVLLIGLYMTPNFQKRFEPSDTEIGQMSDLEFRKYHWQSVMETIQHNSLSFGNGTAGKRDFLYDTYKKHQLTSAYELEYNAHNQYLEFMLDFGFLGLALFILMLGHLVYHFFKVKNSLGLAILGMFMIYFLTESLFQRHDGVVAFSLVISLLVVSKRNFISN